MGKKEDTPVEIVVTVTLSEALRGLAEHLAPIFTPYVPQPATPRSRSTSNVITQPIRIPRSE